MVVRMKMARDAALGMNWLHRSNPIFIHRDLKSSNLLVDDKMQVKVCDFGLSQLIPREAPKMKDKQNAKGTPLWMAPEVMTFKEFNEKCDVYSFGIVLWEILTREEPFAEFQSFDKFKDAICNKHVRPPIPNTCVESLKILMEKCWAPDPNVRPSFQQIIDALDEVIVDVAISDEHGRVFWKKNFLKQADVSWKEFEPKFLEFIKFPSDMIELERVNLLKGFEAVLAESTKNNENAIVDLEQFGRVLAWFGPLDFYDKNEVEVKSDKGEVDNSKILDRIRKLLMKNWFHGDISTPESQIKLSGLPSGTFLVRFSNTQPGCYTISSSSNATIKHQRVSYDPKTRVFVYNGHNYDTLEDIIRDSSSFYIPCPGSKFSSLFNPGVVSSGYT